MTYKNSKIFIVDDNPANTLMLHKLLESEGYLNVKVFNDPELALKAFFLHQPQLVLLDLVMPKIDGISFLTKIQTKITVADVSVIVLTASHVEEMKYKALTLGAQDYIEKPINIIETMQRVKNVLHSQLNKNKFKDLNENLNIELLKRNQDLSSISVTLDTIFETSSEFVFITNENGELTNCNKIASQRFNISTEGHWNLFDFFKIDLNSLTKNNQEMTVKDANKHRLIVSVNSTKVLIKGVISYIYIFKDITAQKEDELNLKYLAETHYITHLPNRLQLNSVLNKCLDNHLELSIIFVSFFDNNKIVEVYGHDKLEYLLLCIASKLRTLSDENNAGLLHWGGNDFVIAVEASIYSNLIEKLFSDFKEPMNILGVELYSMPTAGVFLNEARSKAMVYDDLVHKALLASYEGFRNNQKVTVYDEKLQHKIQYRALIEKELVEAIDNHDFKIAYQPKVELDSKKIVGVEALVRWNHPSLGLVSPSVFIPIAESAGLVKEIGRMVLNIVTDDIQFLKDKYPKLQHVAINVSAPQLDHSFIQILSEVSKSKDIDSSFIELEITETTFLDDLERVVPILNNIRALGYKLAIDDFGTGYSSLSYLHELPINTLKIDRSFILSMMDSDKGLKLVKSIISMSLSLDLNIVAEGIEDNATGMLLSELGVQLGQGFYYHKPEFLNEKVITKLQN
ncbi:EAL domain-containing protein [Pseudoalteromonas denitrificans]|uniref:EAL domain, c-di-GMP-specific phosphodiesterase class I (Or its enzymatically inactive variant) n=1 Tax=Pseudoalteromonas denitrificans DSM 6059 TaxID=1123010 RepID=A0A1I1P411_9GAMM|nr:EAL domain-containing protein [Pseudoalteromonas denitrificans]SFD04694.1 EAL domain, c-di-GMP-specific phosphodiesterase class I (or its enzymatically inactive variant) [Pseudoalteromonas denitrificans DSM 6059]